MSTTPPVKNPTPKTRFQKLAPAILNRHREMVSSDQFDMTSDFALLELTKELVGVRDGNQYTAIASFHRIQGAYEILGIMKTLAEPTPLLSSLPQPQLDHRV
jgi:hypothetical protein